ncbi:hypothetical protein K8I61_10010 [bacterium]|nr:hypothetical protein [bacterium]
MRQKILMAGAVVLAALAMIVARVAVGGAVELREARAHQQAGDITEAIWAYDRALHWYLPGSPTVRASVDALRTIARDAEASGDPETALWAWRVMRSAMYAARGLVQPGRDVIGEANVEIARLVGEKVGAGDPQKNAEAREMEMAILTREVGPNTAWSLVATLAFFGWIGLAVLFIFRAFGPKDAFFRRPALFIGAAFLAVYVIWMLALSRA